LSVDNCAKLRLKPALVEIAYATSKLNLRAQEARLRRLRVKPTTAARRRAAA
jgi:hypothetical protein